jgi:antitoxin VapB
LRADPAAGFDRDVYPRIGINGEAMSPTAKLFMHGRSRAVRLPKAFRLPGKEVKVSRIGTAVLLEPLGNGRSFDAASVWACIDALTCGEFPEPNDVDLAPGREDEPNFD